MALSGSRDYLMPLAKGRVGFGRMNRVTWIGKPCVGLTMAEVFELYDSIACAASFRSEADNDLMQAFDEFYMSHFGRRRWVRYGAC